MHQASVRAQRYDAHEAAEEDHLRLPAQQRADHHQRRGLGAGDQVHAAGAWARTASCTRWTIPYQFHADEVRTHDMLDIPLATQEETDADQRRALVQAVSRTPLTHTAGYALALVGAHQRDQPARPQHPRDPGAAHQARSGHRRRRDGPAVRHGVRALLCAVLAAARAAGRRLGENAAAFDRARVLVAGDRAGRLRAAASRCSPLSRLGVGIGEGAAQPAGFSLVFDRYAKPRRGFATAVIAAAIALGPRGFLGARRGDRRLVGPPVRRRRRAARTQGLAVRVHRWPRCPGFILAAAPVAHARAEARRGSTASSRPRIRTRSAPASRCSPR